jgi:hypothetical protein
MLLQTQTPLYRRLRTLALLEYANIPLQAWIWFSQIGLPLSGPNAAGFFAFAALLLQGGAYWVVKLRQLQAGLVAPEGMALFAKLRLANVPVLALAGVYVCHAVSVAPSRGTIPGFVFFVVAVLEYVNYFHLQLMHDTPGDLSRLRRGGVRKSHLARDLARAHRPAS